MHIKNIYIYTWIQKYIYIIYTLIIPSHHRSHYQYFYAFPHSFHSSYDTWKKIQFFLGKNELFTRWRKDCLLLNIF